MRAAIDCRCNVVVTVRDAATGRVLSRQRKRNLTVTAGRNLIRDKLYGDAVNGITHLAVGTNATAVTAADTALGTEVFRGALTSKTKGTAALTLVYFMGTATANGNTLREAGLFNAASTGTMYARATLTSDIVKTSGITVTFSWVVSWRVS